MFTIWLLEEDPAAESWSGGGRYQIVSAHSGFDSAFAKLSDRDKATWDHARGTNGYFRIRPLLVES